MTTVLALLAGPLVLLSVVDLLRNRLLRRLTIRGLLRRKGEALLVVAGAMIATAIVTASFTVGDTLVGSIRDVARTQLGPIDEVVRITGLERFAGISRNLTESLDPAIDGVLPALAIPAALAPAGGGPEAEPAALVLELSFEDVRRFGNDPTATGLAGAGPTPEPDEVVIPSELADRLALSVGAEVEVFAYGDRRTLRVSRILDEIGVVGYGAPSVFVSPGTIAEMATATVAADATPPTGLVFVSNAGDVFTGVDRTDEVVDHIRSIVGSPAGLEVVEAKRDLLDRADESAASFVRTFTGVGAFTVLAALGLLVNVFVMMAEERRRDMATMRAIGFRRSVLVRSLGAEGTLYALASGVLGAGLGIVLGQAVAAVAESVFNSGVEERFALRLAFAASREAILGGFVVGAALATVACWGASVRIGTMGIVDALRDLPALGHTRRSAGAMMAGAAAVAVGGGCVVASTSLDGAAAAVGALIGVPLVAAGLVPLLAGTVSVRLAASMAATVALVWALAAPGLLGDAFAGAAVAVFVVQGAVLVVAAVVLAVANAAFTGSLLVRAAARAGWPVAGRLAVAYPTAQPLRSGILAGTYALVVFALVLLATANHLFRAQAPVFLEQTRAGFDLVVDSNPARPVTANDLLARPEVDGAASLVRGTVQVATPGAARATTAPLTGFDQNLTAAGVPVLAARDHTFSSDTEVFESVFADSRLVIVSERFLQDAVSGVGEPIRVGDELVITNPRTSDRRTAVVAGILTNDYVGHGALVGAPLAGELLGAEAVANRHLVRLAAEAGPASDVARALAAELSDRGATATSISTLIDRALARQEGFVRLMQAYLVVGLGVGTAGLGVIMLRAVRDRRHQIGVLRALGFSRPRIRTAFLAESAFVAAQGVGIGMVLGVVVAARLLGGADLFTQVDLGFSVPLGGLAAVGAVTLAASLAIGTIPANRAARIPPAAALRSADQ